MTGDPGLDSFLGLIYLAGLLAWCRWMTPRRWNWICSEAKRRARGMLSL